MEIISVILLLVFAVIVSGIVSRILPLPLPRPLFQIAIGAAIGMIADWRVVVGARNRSGVCSPTARFPAHAICHWRVAPCSN